MGKSLIISDLRRAAKDSSAVTRQYKPGKWQYYEYSCERSPEESGKQVRVKAYPDVPEVRCEEHISGTCVYCGPFEEVAELEIPLKASGLYRIYLGIHYGMCAWPLESRLQLAGIVPAPFILRARLSGQDWRDMIEPETPSTRQTGYFTPTEGTVQRRYIGWEAIDEVYWRTARLDGDSLLISPHREEGHEWAAASLAYVRLEEVGQDELADYEKEKPRPDTKRLFGAYDGSHPPRNAEELGKWLEPLRDSDYETIAWGASSADQCFYPTKVGRQSNDLWHTASVAAKRAWPQDNFDMLKAAAELCHEMGIECLGSMRPAAGRLPMSNLWESGGSFFEEHPEFCCVSERGERIGHFSLAFAEVRKMLIDIMRDYFDGRNLDGVHFYFNRCYPFVMYEEPVVEDFKDQYAEDPRELPFADERWLVHRCGYVTTFMRELRKMVDEVAQQRGRKLQVCLTIVNSIENCWINGYDIRTWFTERLVDGCMVHSCFSGIKTDGDIRVTPETVKPIQELADQHGIKIWADLYARFKPAEHIRQQALSFYEAGIYGLGTHDYYVRSPRKSEWNMMRLAGHRAELKQWRIKALGMARSYPVTSVNGMSNDVRYTMASNG